MIRIEHERIFQTPIEQGFSAITDITNWPKYWPGLVRVEPESRWGTPGDQTRVILRLFGREVELAMTLREFVPNQLVAYDSVQGGLPSAPTSAIFGQLMAASPTGSSSSTSRGEGLADCSTGRSFAEASTARYGRRCSTWSGCSQHHDRCRSGAERSETSTATWRLRSDTAQRGRGARDSNPRPPAWTGRRFSHAR